MSISAAYAAPAEYRRVVGMTDAGLDADIAADLMAVSRYLDGEMRRFFTRDASPVIRIFAPAHDGKNLAVSDLSGPPTLVRVDTAGNGTFSTTLAAADYILLPLDAPLNPEPWPFTSMQLTGLGLVGAFSVNQRVEITARWGWPAVPEPIRRAAIHITAILRLETPRATKRIAELGDTVETSPQAQNIVRQLTNQYKRWLI